MSRSAKELFEWATAQPPEALLGITIAEARTYLPWRVVPAERTRPDMLVGRKAIVLDLPPGYVLA
jgi:hypothetical protein